MKIELISAMCGLFIFICLICVREPATEGTGGGADKAWVFAVSLFLIEGLLLYNFVLVSVIHQHESAIGIHVTPSS